MKFLIAWIPVFTQSYGNLYFLTRWLIRTTLLLQKKKIIHILKGGKFIGIRMKDLTPPLNITFSEIVQNCMSALLKKTAYAG